MSRNEWVENPRKLLLDIVEKKEKLLSDRADAELIRGAQDIYHFIHDHIDRLQIIKDYLE